MKTTRRSGKKLSLWLLIIGSLAVTVSAGYYILFSRPDNAGNTVADNTFGWKYPVAKFPKVGGTELAYSSIRDPGGISKGLPVRLKIPAIGVDSAIEDALITPDGRMDVPAGSRNVAWFALGPHPGNVGSAVIGGHFGIDNGVPKVFFNLDKLRAGDKIHVVNDKGDTLSFIVRRTQSFDRNADATSVFTSSDGLAHLNLITCEGLWNQVNDTYPTRLVIFTDSIPSEGAVVVNTKLPDTAINTPKPKPTFTPTPIPSASPTTIVPSVTDVIPEPTIPEEIVTPDSEEQPSGSQSALIQTAKSLYATPTDGLVTTSLLVSITFIGLRILLRI